MNAFPFGYLHISMCNTSILSMYLVCRVKAGARVGGLEDQVCGRHWARRQRSVLQRNRHSSEVSLKKSICLICYIISEIKQHFLNMYKLLYSLECRTMYLRAPWATSLNATVSTSHAHLPVCVAGPPTFTFRIKKGLNGRTFWCEPLVLLGWSVFLWSPLRTARSQAGVKQDVGCRRLDGGCVDLRHLVVVKLVPALFEAVLTIGCVMATVQSPIVVLVRKRNKLEAINATHQQGLLD